MIKEFVKAWDENNNKLLEKYRIEEPGSYRNIVIDLIDIVINPYIKEHSSYPLSVGLNSKKMTVIDDGDYQGTKIYIIPADTCEPYVEDYYFTNNYYGSCSGCDTYYAIESEIDYDENGNIKLEIAKKFHSLALNLLQKFKNLSRGSEE